MDMNLFYRRILDYSETIKHRASQVIVENSPGADKDTLRQVVGLLDAELSASCNDLINNLQTLEKKSKAVKPVQKKATRTTRKKK